MGVSELIGIYLLAGAGTISQGGYVSIGLGYAPAINRPEVELSSPIFDAEIGVSRGTWAVYLRHSSGVFVTEQGAGFNLVGIKYTFGGK